MLFNIKKLFVIFLFVPFAFVASANAQSSVSITGDGTADVKNMSTSETIGASGAITGDANLTGFYFAQKNSNIRKRPGTAHDVILTITKGTEIYVDGQEGEWYRVKLGDHEFGYIYSRLLEKTPPRQ